jgi:xanthine dehydrogenase accessory factor
MRDGESRVVDLDMNDEVLGTGMPCGGSMRVYVEPVLPKPTLWILGHGRVAECLCHIGAMLDLRVTVIDDMADETRYPDAARLITDDIDYETLQPESSDYVVVATQHKGDHQSMKRSLQSKVGYVALIASRKRARLVMDYLRSEGFGAEDLSRVYAPSGLDLGCRTPEEIAVAVLGEIVMLRRGGSGGLMRDKLQMREAPLEEAAMEKVA